MDNMNKMYIIILLISGTITGGCVYVEDYIDEYKIDDISKYHSYIKTPDFKLKMYNADNNTKRMILSVLDNVDNNTVRYISSISIVSKDDINSVCSGSSVGCTIGNFTIDGKLTEVKIYLLDRNSYNGLCNSFERTLYHEIGHVVYFYKFGNYDIKNTDELYKQSLELYAEKYADRFSRIDKLGCDEKIIEELKKELEIKEEIYQYSMDVLSKWDKYRNRGMPRDIYSEYTYDYDLYLDAKREYEELVEKLKFYNKKAQE